MVGFFFVGFLGFGDEFEKAPFYMFRADEKFSISKKFLELLFFFLSLGGGQDGWKEFIVYQLCLDSVAQKTIVRLRRHHRPQAPHRLGILR